MRFRWNKKWGVIGFSALLLLLLLGIGVIWLADCAVKSHADQVYHSVADIPAKRVALVLGTSKTFYGRPNQYYLYRINAVTELYNAGKIKKVLISGDNSVRDYNEPAEMRFDLLQRGIPDRDIVLDFAGFRTLDSVLRAHDIFGLDDFIIVSQQFHCERALYIAAGNNIRAIGYAAAEVNGILAQKVKKREYLARLAAVVDIQILGTRPKFGGQMIRIE